MIRDPRVAFEMLFGAGSERRRSRGAPQREPAAFSTGSPARSRRSKRDLGAADRERIDKYLEDIRELERRIQARRSAQHRAAKRASCPKRRPAFRTRSRST